MKRSRRRSASSCIRELYETRDRIAEAVSLFQTRTGLRLDSVEILAQDSNADLTPVGMLRISATDRVDENTFFVTTYTTTQGEDDHVESQ